MGTTRTPSEQLKVVFVATALILAAMGTSSPHKIMPLVQLITVNINGTTIAARGYSI